nr:unnamed protein product [Callosobruchus chinensis]
MSLIRAVLHIIIDPLVYLVNLSFVTGIFPERLKLGKLVPIHKTGNVKSVENYRPIIMPSVFSKVFEFQGSYIDFWGTWKSTAFSQIISMAP